MKDKINNSVVASAAVDLHRYTACEAEEWISTFFSAFGSYLDLCSPSFFPEEEGELNLLDIPPASRLTIYQN